MKNTHINIISVFLSIVLFTGVQPAFSTNVSFDRGEQAYVIRGNGANKSWLTEVGRTVSTFAFNQIHNSNTDYSCRTKNLGFNPSNGLLYAHFLAQADQLKKY